MTSREVSIRTNEPAEGGVIVPALQIVQASLPVVDISPVAEGVVLGQGVEHSCGGGGGIEELAPGVVVVGDNLVAIGIQQSHDIALKVQDVEVDVTVVGHGDRVALGVVGEAHDQAVELHVGQETIFIVVIILTTSIALAVRGDPAGSQAVGIIGHVPGGAGLGHGFQLAATFPGVCPSAVGQSIADGVVGGVEGIGANPLGYFYRSSTNLDTSTPITTNTTRIASKTP